MNEKKIMKFEKVKIESTGYYRPKLLSHIYLW